MELYLLEKGLLDNTQIADYLKSKGRLHKIIVSCDTLVEHVQ
jgi:hypothetical protein